MPQMTVNADNFALAETHRMMDALQREAGGVNQFSHNREAAAIDKQTVIRMNRDTLYSFAVVDIAAGATLSLPDAGERYLSAMVVNEHHFINRVFHDPGTYDLTVEEFDSPYVVVAVRTLVDPANAGDLDAVAAVQDQLAITAQSARPFELPEYETESLDRTRNALLALAAEQGSFERSFGGREEVDPVHHLIGSAAGWGGLPDAEATYIGVSPNLPVGEYELTVPHEVPVDGFWSISVYNAEGYFEPNEQGAYSVNNITAIPNDDDSVTVRFGGNGENSIPITEGWNYLVRLYRPRPEILSGAWSFPTLER
ncbi:carboxylesterase [Nocardioides sp. Root1257]|uniref:DUF1254 domain-containing protein n=1 Tax=unclassified Nocardioides TaxID=2615069 RepID=UPI00070180B6|nr:MULTISPECIES: DUF1254 domain-containing protein [unclassified Nocardioides]KQW52509.1 carboxylesterase [Nocardioides sp. Root1257]KRC54572.1 carboxylesterase [Nocardioides sp. Root224]